MKKVVITIAVLILSALFVLLISSFYQSDPEFTTTSPNRTYSVYMQDKEVGNSNHMVRFNVTKNEKPIIEHGIFYSDSNQYFVSEPDHTWVSENILRFGSVETAPSMSRDEISVINQTGRVVKYLKVSAGNDFLILELQPQTRIRLFTRPQTDKMSSLSWIGGYVKLDGNDMSQWGRSFNVEGKYKSPAHYCVIIKEEVVEVQSREFDSSSGVESGKVVEVFVAKNPLCQ